MPKCPDCDVEIELKELLGGSPVHCRKCGALSEPTQKSAILSLAPLLVVWPLVNYFLLPLELPAAVNVCLIAVVAFAIGTPSYLYLIRLRRRRSNEDLDP